MRRRTRRSPTSGAKNSPQVGSLIQNAVALMISSGGTAVLGLLFWGIAARLTSATAVGRASAEIAAMVLLANIAQLSFTGIFERFLYLSGSRMRRFITSAYAISALVALIVAIVFVSAGLGNSSVPSWLAWRILFVAAVVLWTIFILQDAVLTSLRATRWVPVENILFALAKIALLPIFLAVAPRQGIFIAWTIPLVVAAGAVNWYLFRRRIPMHEQALPLNEEFPTIREIVSLSLGQYITWIISASSSSLVVLIVIARLGAEANAYYYVPSLISTGLTVLLWNLVTSFLVEASVEPDAIRRHANVSIRAGILVLVPSITIGVLFAPEILQIFGPNYAAHSTTLLRMLLLSIPSTVLVWFYASFAWLDRRVWWLAARELISGVVYFGIVFLLIGHFGILAVGIAALVSSGLMGILFLPASVKRYRLTANAGADRPTSGKEIVSDPEA